MKLIAAILLLCLAACSVPVAPLTIKQSTIRDQESNITGDSMVQNEKLRRLHGAVSIEERKQRLGQYYVVLWNDTSTKVSREIRFQYQQGGSKVKTISRSLNPFTSSGKEEFSIIGDNYFKNGRVLAWKIDLIANGEIIASKQSYLWE